MLPDQRPRERLIRQGVAVLSDAELLAIVLHKGTRQENVMEISNRLIAKYGLVQLSSCSLSELQMIKGIGEVKAAQVLASFELGRRHAIGNCVDRCFSSSKEVFAYFLPKLSWLKKEYFIVVHLDTRNRMIKEEVITVGILDSLIIHPREVFRSAVKESAYALIFVHNHPSGDAAPSVEDQQITQQLAKAGELFGISVLDHVIIGKDSYYSFKDAGLL